MVQRARQLPFDRRSVNTLVGEAILQRSSLWSKYLLINSLYLSPYLMVALVQGTCQEVQPTNLLQLTKRRPK